MNQFFKGILLVLLACSSLDLMAQTTVTTSGGTLYSIPYFSGTYTIATSPIVGNSAGDISIATPLLSAGYGSFVLATAATNGGMFVTTGQPYQSGGTTVYNSAGYRFGQDSAAYQRGMYYDQQSGRVSLINTNATGAGLQTTLSERFTVVPNGNVGIGTVIPSGPLSVTPFEYGSGTASQSGTTVTGASTSFTTSMVGSQLTFANGVNAGTVTAFTDSTHLTVSTSQTVARQGYSVSYTGLQVTSGGGVGIGTTTPSALLEVNGTAQVDGNLVLNGTGASVTFPDGSTQSTAYTGVTCGGDYAETVDVSGDRTNYGPGDVLVIGPENGSDVIKSTEPYSTLVSGIYSTKPGVVGRRQASDPKTSKTEVPMAMVGIVPTKVSAENGAIRRGDLLVTSSLPGYAMKGTDRTRMLGAVIGKALGSLDSETGIIEVLVTLQ